MANRNFRKNLLLSLSALGGLFGGVQQASAINAQDLYLEANDINDDYDKATYLMKTLLNESVQPLSRKTQVIKKISTDQAKVRFLYEASRAIVKRAKSFTHISEERYGKGAPEYELSEIRETAMTLKKLGDLWG